MRVFKTAKEVPAKLDEETFYKAKSFAVDTYRYIIVEKWFNMIFSTVRKKMFLPLFYAPVKCHHWSYIHNIHMYICVKD